jgi:2-polyprenyl-3-methyl-5-hydroxy-6-metoxy-1,4-benzoquinol methylase
VREQDLPLCYPGSYYTHGSKTAWAPRPAPKGSLRDHVRRAIRRAADRVPDKTVPPSLALVGSLLAMHSGLRRRARLGLVDGLAPSPDEHGRCLEVGPGQGIDLLRLRLLGWDAHGLEVDPVAAECARQTSGSEVRVGTLASTDYPAEHFDLVYMSHVFEHLPDPAHSLRRCLGLLKPGGRLVLLYPNPRALTVRCYGSLSPIWDPPRHLVLPPISAILQLIGRSGFVDARARTLAARAAVNAAAARRCGRGQAGDGLAPERAGLLDRGLALAESLLVGLGWPVGEEVLLHARKPPAAASPRTPNHEPAVARRSDAPSAATSCWLTRLQRRRISFASKLHLVGRSVANRTVPGGGDQMERTRITRAGRPLMILAVVALAAAGAQAQQPIGLGEPGQALATAQEVRAAADAALAAASPETFGTSYITLSGEDFINFYTGEYNHSGGGALRWPTSGTAFITAQVSLPVGVTVTEIEYYVVDNNAANGTFYVYLSTPGTNTFTYLGGGTTSGASTAVVTYPVTITPYVVDSTTRLVVGINTNVTDGTIAIAGARIGYTGSPGTLVFLPAPDRFVDTRIGQGGKTGAFTVGESYDFTITGVAGRDGNVIPAGAKAVLGTVTAVSPTGGGLFKILPGGTATTTGTSTVNFNAGFNTASAYQVRLDSSGRVRGWFSSATPSAQSQLLVDVVGYYK